MPGNQMRPACMHLRLSAVTRCGRDPIRWFLLTFVLHVALSGVLRLVAQSPRLIVSIDRTTRGWTDLAMGGPSSEDDADASRNPNAVFRYVPGFGNPHADAGARGLDLPRLNDGRFALNGDDPANSTWFDTRTDSRVFLDLGTSLEIARINVFSWHSGALSPQRYTLWAADGDGPPDVGVAVLGRGWRKLAEVDTTTLGEGGKQGSCIQANGGVIGRYRYLLFDLVPNKPEWSRGGFLSEIDVHAAGRKLDAVVVVPRVMAQQTLSFGDMQRSKPLKDETEFLVAGRKLYEFGSMDGGFPRVGRLDGNQGGVWHHPIKLVDAFGIELREDGLKPWPLLGPSRFEHDFVSAQFHFERDGLKVTRRDFVPEEEPALVSMLELRNESDRPRELTVRFSTTVHLLPSYESGLPDGADALTFQDGLLVGSDSAMPGTWSVVSGCDRSPIGHGIAGTHGFMDYRVRLPAKAWATLGFLVVGEQRGGADAARKRFQAIAGRPQELLEAKQALYRGRILGGVRFECSDRAVNDAFLSAKANVVMSAMDLRPHYPAPFLAAGFPIYTWLFGCDSLLSTAGVAAAGFQEEARDTLTCLLHYADIKKQGAHEVASNGRLLGWDHVQEGPQLVAACWEHFLWTRDLAFLRRAYPVCRGMIEHMMAAADRDRDGYLEGPALMEQPGMGSERLDSVCYLHAAYRALAGMAETLGAATAQEYRGLADDLRLRFNRDWWNAKEGMWACSLRAGQVQTMDDFWAVVFPQRTGIADPAKAIRVMDRIQAEWVNATWGFVAQRKPDINGEGVGVVHNNVLAQTAFAFGRPDFAWRLMKQSARAPTEERMLGAFDETLPGGGDLMQLWSFAPFLQNIVEGLAGVRPQAETNRVDFFPQLPVGLEWFRLEECHVGTHAVSVEVRKAAAGIAITVSHVKGDAPLSGTLWLSPGGNGPVLLNGRDAGPVRRSMPTSGVEVPGLEYRLEPGQRLAVSMGTP